MEVGLGIHGEPGAASRDAAPVDAVVAQVGRGEGEGVAGPRVRIQLRRCLRLAVLPAGSGVCWCSGVRPYRGVRPLPTVQG